MAKRVLVVDDDASITRHLGTARVGALWARQHRTRRQRLV